MPYIRTIEIDPALVHSHTFYYAGIQGENHATEVLVDISAWLALWETGVATASFMRPDGNAYSISVLTSKGGIVTWSPSSVDTEIAGKCVLEITLTDGGDIVKTQQIPMYIGEDIGIVVPESSIEIGDMTYSGATGTKYLNIGTAGQVLAVNVGATAPEWKSFGAADVPIVDAGSKYTATNVETALEEVRDAVDALEASVVGSNVALTDAGDYYTTNNVEAALQQLGPQLAHAHGNITNDGKIGTTSGLVVVTGAAGAVGALAAGTTAQYMRGDGVWATTPIASSRNILDNWDFRNPVNQHGLTTYGDAGTTVDRWNLANSADQVEVKTTLGGHIYITAGAASYGVLQTVEYGTYYSGWMLTFSVYVIAAGSGNSWISIYDGTGYSNSSVMAATGLYSVTRTLNAASTQLTCIIYTPIGGTVGIQMAKLEIGSTSTLGSDTPANYNEQLARCKRYYERILGPAYCGFAMGFQYEDEGRCVLRYLTKRTYPTITFVGGFLQYCLSTDSGLDEYFAVTSATAQYIGTTSCQVLVETNSAGNSGECVMLCQDAGATGYIEISAEL